MMSVSVPHTDYRPASTEGWMNRKMERQNCLDCGIPIQQNPGRGRPLLYCDGCRRLRHVKQNQAWDRKVSRESEQAQVENASLPDLDYRTGTLRFGEKVEAAKLAARQSAPKHEEFTYEGCEVAE